LFGKIVIAAAMAGAVLGALATSAAAQDIGYQRVGRWNVVAVMEKGRFAFCGAEVHNGDLPLRIATDGKAWRIGIPYGGKVGEVEFYAGFEVAGEVATFKADGDGWASTEIDRDQLDAFRQNPEYRITVDEQEETWNLKGAGGAIKTAMECARNGGMKDAAPEENDEAVAPAQNDMLAAISGGFTGAASGNGQSWPYIVKNVRATGGDKFEATITWTSLRAVHKIKGFINDKRLFFKEVGFVKRGDAVLGCEYTVPLKPAPVLKGRYRKCSNGGDGSVTVKVAG
jgi:hypothetical protein